MPRKVFCFLDLVSMCSENKQKSSKPFYWLALIQKQPQTFLKIHFYRGDKKLLKSTLHSFGILTKRHFQLREVFVLLLSFEEQMLVFCTPRLGSRRWKHLQNSELYSHVFLRGFISGVVDLFLIAHRKHFLLPSCYCSVACFMSNQQSSLGAFGTVHNFCFSTYFSASWLTSVCILGVSFGLGLRHVPALSSTCCWEQYAHTS